MITTKVVGTVQATIYCGLKERYDGEQHTYDEAIEFCKEYCKIGLCVTVTPTTFCYTTGSESGIIVGLINYPRFPKCKEDIYMCAEDLAKNLMKKFNQNRVSLICGHYTIMLEAEELS